MEKSQVVKDSVVLVVDLDNSFAKIDFLFFCFWATLQRAPHRIFLIPWWWARGGRPEVKFHLAKALRSNDVRQDMFHPKIKQILEEYRESGSKVVLATGAHRLVAEMVHSKIFEFDSVMASEGKINLTGEVKLNSIVQTLGDSRFVYIGDSESDLAIWRQSILAIVVNPSKKLKARLRKETFSQIHIK